MSSMEDVRWGSDVVANVGRGAERASGRRRVAGPRAMLIVCEDGAGWVRPVAVDGVWRFSVGKPCVISAIT